MDPYVLLILIFLTPTIVILFARLGLAKLGWQRGGIFHWTLGVVMGLAVLLAIIWMALMFKFDIYPPGFRSGVWIIAGAGAITFLVSILWQSNSSFWSAMWSLGGGFAAGLAFGLTYLVVDEGERKIYYDDERYRIVDTQRMFGACDFMLFVKHGFYEQAYDFGELRCYDFTHENVAQIEILELPSGYQVEWTLVNWDADLGEANPFVVKIQR